MSGRQQATAILVNHESRAPIIPIVSFVIRYSVFE